MLRRYEDARITRVPTLEELHRLEQTIPGVTIQINVKHNSRLSSLRDQDSYSYEVAVLFIGGDTYDDLELKRQRVIERLPLEYAPVAG
jgi:hypothetical protein